MQKKVWRWGSVKTRIQGLTRMRRRHSKDIWKRKVMLIVSPCQAGQRRSKHTLLKNLSLSELTVMYCVCMCVCGGESETSVLHKSWAGWELEKGGIRGNLLIWSKKSFNHRSCDCKWICSLSSALIEVPAGRHMAMRRLRTWGPGSAADILCHCCYIRKNCIRAILLTISFFLYKGNYRPGRGKWSGDLRCQFCFACCSFAHVDVAKNHLSHIPDTSRIPVWTRWLFLCGCFSCNKTVIID